KQIPGWFTILIKRFEIIVPGRTVTFNLFLDRADRFRAVSKQLLFANTPQKLSCITTVGKPSLLLPPRETRSPIRNLGDNLSRNRLPDSITSDAVSVGELGSKHLVRSTVSDTPWAECVNQFLLGVWLSFVDESSCLITGNTLFLGWLNTPSREWIRMILENG